VDGKTQSTTPNLVAVFLHGFGAGGEDLVPLASHLMSAVQGHKVKFIFPAAPLMLPGGGGGRAWYPLDLQELVMRAMSGQLQAIVEETPPGLIDAREKLSLFITEIRSAFNVGLDRIVIGGFSQGATCALDTILHLKEGENPAAVVLWSPPVVSLTAWSERVKAHPGLVIQHTHGQRDPIVPFFMATMLEDRVFKANAKVEWSPFQGEHTIPPQALKSLASLLANLSK
jgi:phospholipase/carboxylesterase